MLTQSTDDGTLLIHICKEKDVLVGHNAAISERLAMSRLDHRILRMFVVEVKEEEKDPLHHLNPNPNPNPSSPLEKKRAADSAEFED
jgi:hypothetical protein